MQYINPQWSKTKFESLRKSPYYVDKTGLISEISRFIGLESCYLCFTRPRRFGKTNNAQMTACFFARGLEAEQLFEGLEVTKNEEAMKHFAAHDVIYIDFSKLPQNCKGYSDYLSTITNGIISELRELFPDAGIDSNEEDVFVALNAAYNKLGARFCFIIDEWDSMFYNENLKDGAKDFLMFLKQLLKDSPYVELAYMTGVLPIAKYTSGSELNMFMEFSVMNDPLFDKFFGFSESEVKQLLVRHKKVMPNSSLDFKELKQWYDGYVADDGTSKFNPRSVVIALSCGKAGDYWTDSGPNEEIFHYIEYNVAGVRDDIARMVEGQAVDAKMNRYAAVSMNLNTPDEIFSAMVVYGCLTYYDGQVRIPNYELMRKFEDVLNKQEMGYLAKLAENSKALLNATTSGNSSEVAQIIESMHDQEIPLLNYNCEADLAALVNVAYLEARNRYFVRRERPAGKGVADVVFIPRNPTDTRCTPFIVELKACGGTKGSAAAALTQIKQRNYASIFNDALTDEQNYAHPPLAVAIVWDKQIKVHECAIEGL